MKELRKHMAARQMSAALNIRNGPNSAAYSPMDLPLQSEVRVWRENGGWQGPFRVVAHNGQNVILELLNGPATFRSTMVASYHRSFNQDISDAFNDHTSVEDADPSSIVVRPNPVPEAPARRKRERPKGSRNRSSAAHQVAIVHLFAKKVFNHELAIKLRKSGVIIASGCHGSSLDLTLGHVTIDIRVEETILAHSEGATPCSRVRLQVEYKTGNPPQLEF
jgi:hypothetical protein